MTMSDNTNNVGLVCMATILGSLFIIVLLGTAIDFWRRRRANNKRLQTSKAEEEGQEETSEKLPSSLDVDTNYRNLQQPTEEQRHRITMKHNGRLLVSMAFTGAGRQPLQQQALSATRGRSSPVQSAPPTPIWSTSKHLPFVPIEAQVQSITLYGRPLPPLPDINSVLQSRNPQSENVPRSSALTTSARTRPEHDSTADIPTRSPPSRPTLHAKLSYEASDASRFMLSPIQKSFMHTPMTSAYASPPVTSTAISSSRGTLSRLAEGGITPYRQPVFAHGMQSPNPRRSAIAFPPRTSSITPAHIDDRVSSPRMRQVPSPFTPYTPDLTFSSSPPSSWTMPRPLPRLPPLAIEPNTPSTARTPVREDDLFFLPIQSPSLGSSFMTAAPLMPVTAKLMKPLDVDLWKEKPVPPVPLAIRAANMTPSSGSRPMDIDGEQYRTFSVSRKPVPISKRKMGHLQAAKESPSTGRAHVVEIRPVSTQSAATVFELDEDDEITPPEQDEKWFGIGQRRLTTKIAGDEDPSPAPSITYPERPTLKVRRVRNRLASSGES